MTSRLRTAALALTALTLALTPLSASGLEPVSTDPSFDAPGERFTIGILPDTQFYSRYATAETGNQYQSMVGSEPFSAQTQWLVDNAGTYNIAGVLHLGDVVDQVQSRRTVGRCRCRDGDSRGR